MDKQIILKSLENAVRAATDEGISIEDILLGITDAFPETEEVFAIATANNITMNGKSSDILKRICLMIEKISKANKIHVLSTFSYMVDAIVAASEVKTND